MQIRNKYYPYPVIIEGEDYYIDSEFSSKLEQYMDGYNIRLIIKTTLKNKELEEMLKTGDVKIVHHLECPQTCFRKIVETNEYEVEYLLKNLDVNGLVQISTFLIAAKDLHKYSNLNFSNDYKGFKFNIEKGCILAIGNQYNVYVNKIKDDLANTSSIFSIVPSTDPLDNMMKVELTSQKLIISLPEKTYHQYYNIQEYIDIQPVMHSMIIIPALVYVFSELRSAGNQLYEYEDYRWFRSLTKACEKIKIIVDEENLKNIDILTVAQQLLDGPISKAVEYCSMGGGIHED